MHGNRWKVEFLRLLAFLTIPGGIRATQSVEQSIHEKRSFRVDLNEHVLLKDGKPFQYISGSLHYSRIPPSYWADRLEKAKAAGLDAVQIYIPWNFHSPEEGVYNFDENRDLEKFIRLIAKQNLLAIVRAGPYICAEWSFGGLPPWLLRKNPLMTIRSSDPEYFNHVISWFEVLLPKLKKHLYVNGGPIIMIQLENEYGSYPLCDSVYMKNLHRLARQHLGNDVILFTTDGASFRLLQCGSPDPGLISTIDFRPSSLPPNISFSSLQKFNASLPWINSEFYTGWYDRWGDKHSKVDAQLLVSNLIGLMKYSPRVSVNMYMFHGGTTFGFWYGNNLEGSVTTSYDFDAPVSEAGDLTYKYELLRKAIHEFKNITPPPSPRNTTKGSYGTLPMTLISHFVCSLDHTEAVRVPVNMEAKLQYEGLGLYAGEIPTKSRGKVANVTLGEFADVAHVYTSTSDIASLEWHTTLASNTTEVELNLERVPNHILLVVVIENYGYINYGYGMQSNVKGLFGDVKFDGIPWSKVFMGSIKRPLKVPRVHGICKRSRTASSDWPTQGGIFAAQFNISAVGGVHDTFIQLDSFSRGLVTINDNLLGRFDQLLGPQQRLYVPRDFLRVGVNWVLVGEFRNITEKSLKVSFHTQQKWLR